MKSPEMLPEGHQVLLYEHRSVFPGLTILGRDERCEDCLMFVYNPHGIREFCFSFMSLLLYQSRLLYQSPWLCLQLEYRYICQEMRGFDHSVYKGSVGDWLSNLKI